MADNVSLPLTGAGGTTALVSTEEVTTLNGGAVTAQQVQRVAAAIRTADGTAVDLPGDATNGLDVDVTRVVPGTGATNLGKAVDSAAGATDTGVAALAIRDNVLSSLTPAEGDYAPLRVNTAGALWSYVAGFDTGVVLNVAADGGSVDHDEVDAGFPVKIGGQARTTNPAAVADADRVNAIFDDVGRQVVVPFGVRDLTGHQHTQITTTGEATIANAGGAGNFQDLLMLILTNQTGTAVNVTIKDDTAGTTRMVIALAANGGAVIPFPAPVKQAVANKPWTATLSAGSITVNIFAQFVTNV